MITPVLPPSTPGLRRAPSAPGLRRAPSAPGRRRALRACVGLGAFVAATALVGCASVSDAAPLQRPVANQDALQASTYMPECLADELVRRPSSYTITCGDGLEYLDGLTWTGWGQEQAVGVGTLVTVICDPTCTQGREARYRVRSVAGGMIRGPLGGVYSKLTITALGDRPRGWANTETVMLPTADPADGATSLPSPTR